MATEMEVADAFDRIADEVPGFIAASLVDGKAGMTLAVRSSRWDLDVAVATADGSELVKQKQEIMNALRLKADVEDAILTMGDRIHFIKVVSPTAFIYLLIDRASAEIETMRAIVTKHAKAML